MLERWSIRQPIILTFQIVMAGARFHRVASKPLAALSRATLSSTKAWRFSPGSDCENWFETMRKRVSPSRVLSKKMARAQSGHFQSASRNPDHFSSAIKLLSK
jgi:hypothetical protein